MRAFHLVHGAATLASLAVAGWMLGRPLLRERAQRGNYAFGWYGWQELWLGVPAALVAVVLLALLLVPRARRVRVGMRAMLATAAVLSAVAAFDLTHAFLLRGAWRSDFWLDLGHIDRADNEPDPQLGFRRKPFAQWTGRVPGTDRVVEYATDEHGFRNPRDRRRAELVFVGDSYTEAAQIERESCFVELVGERLGKSVLNLGRGGYGPQQEAIVLERHALPASPKVVVWQVFDGNDLRDAEQFASWSLGERGELPLAERYFANSFFHPLVAATLRDKRGDFATLRFDDGHTEPVAIRYRWSPEQVTERPSGWREAERAYRGGLARCRAAGVPVVVVFVPVAARILQERLTFADPEDASRYAPQSAGNGNDFAGAMRRLCAELSVPMIDLTEVFAAAARERADGIYLPRDEHLDRRGHELVADALCAWYAARG